MHTKKDKPTLIGQYARNITYYARSIVNYLHFVRTI